VALWFPSQEAGDAGAVPARLPPLCSPIGSLTTSPTRAVS
jgi:hypothetical protein